MIKTAGVFFHELGLQVIFTKEIIKQVLSGKGRTEDILEQVYKMTTQSLPTTMLAGFFVGAVMTVQFTLQMRDFGALSYLGGLATSGTFREVGPLLIGFMLCGKIGAFTASELGTMKITEQFDAIRCLGSDPLREIILPRFVGIIGASVFLLVGGLFASVFGGLILGVLYAGVSADEYIRYIPRFLLGPSILSGLFKSVTFAVLLAAICTYQGYHVEGGSRGVGRAVIRTAVISMVAIVFFDWMTSLLMDVALDWSVRNL